MCLSCGCHEPYESREDPANITMDHLNAAAAVAGISPDEAAANILADVERGTALGITTEGLDPSGGVDLDALRSSGQVRAE